MTLNVNDPSVTPIATAVVNVISSVFVAETLALAIVAPAVMVPVQKTLMASVVSSPVTVVVVAAPTRAAITPGAYVTSLVKILVMPVNPEIGTLPIAPGTLLDAPALIRHHRTSHTAYFQPFRWLRYV